VLDGRVGNDHLVAQGNDDQLRGGVGADRLDGGSGRDTATYPKTPSRVFVNLATGKASGGGGADRLTGIENVKGSNANDVLTGNGGSNELFGQGGDDSVSGGAGDDLLDGGAGRDSLDGGDGTDRCTGGETVKGCEVPQASAEALEELALLGLTTREATSLRDVILESFGLLPRARAH
jgi:Ca2+-binding RTX toxin-like protein